MTKVSFITLGCRSNQAETMILKNLFKAKGFTLVAESTAADIVVINSCTVTSEGDRETRRIIQRACRLNPFVRVAITGCLAQVQKEAVLAWPNVFWVVGNDKKMTLAEIIHDDLFKSSSRVIVPAIRQRPFTMPHVCDMTSRVRMNLKIQDGCDNFCAYCEVPFGRGRPRSRIFEDIIAAAHYMTNEGCKEIVLTGINVGLYSFENKTLIDVVLELEKIQKLERIRLSSVEYASWLIFMLDLMLPAHKLCRFLHLPIQSGSDRILKKMGRKYQVNEISTFVNSAVSKVPGILIGTDVIVGFPGESKSDFDATVSLLKESPFNFFHVFSYSDRNKARSRLFKGHVPDDEIKFRADYLRKLGANKLYRFMEVMIGDIVTVIIEYKKADHWVGHTDNYVKISIISSSCSRNQIIQVKVVGIVDGVLQGELL